MGRLVIAHHKSYHPYRRDNIERVRKDEEEARQKEAQEDGRIMLADSEARIDRLRERADGRKTDRRRRDSDPAPTLLETTSISTSTGHINFFQDLESNTIARALKDSKKLGTAEKDQGVPLAPTAKDLTPWYSQKASKKVEDTEDERGRRDAARKNMNDPLTFISHQLTSTSPSGTASQTSHSTRRTQIHAVSSTSSNDRPSELDARLAREKSERQRALSLIQRKKREMNESQTSVLDDDPVDGYSNLYNRRDVEAAHRGRERRFGRESERRRGSFHDDQGYRSFSRKQW